MSEADWTLTITVATMAVFVFALFAASSDSRRSRLWGVAVIAAWLVLVAAMAMQVP